MSLYLNTGRGREDRAESPNVPVPAVIERVVRLTEKERLFRILPAGRPSGGFDPGQFFMAGLPGFGEAPFSVASPPYPPSHPPHPPHPFKNAPGDEERGFEFCIRAVGNLTNAIHRLRKGDVIWIRGPFGRGFKLHEFKGKDILFVAGGIGIVPMRSLIKAVLAERGAYGALTLIYGSKTPDDILFRDELKDWAEHMDVRLTVDADSPGWSGHVGVVTTLIPGLKVDPSRTSAVVIGPPVMYRFVILSLWDKMIPREEILLSLERRMKCGLGKCGHCQINHVYTCQEGPVFRLSEIKNLYEAL